MRKLTIFLLAVLSALALPDLHSETVKTMPKPTGYVDDYANVISGDAQSGMEALCREIHDKTKAQVFVVTINSLDSSSVEEFSNQLFHKWKIGEKKTDRGVLILLAIKEHKYRLEVGYGFEGILNDAKAGDIGRQMVPNLKTANYDSAAETSLSEVSQLIAADSNVTLDTLSALTPSAPPVPSSVADKPQPAPYKAGPVLSAIIAIIIFLILISGVAGFFWVIASVIRNGIKSHGRSFFGNFSSSGGSSSSSGGDFDGGDGGDSGGGGASGDW